MKKQAAARAATDKKRNKMVDKLIFVKWDDDPVEYLCKIHRGLLTVSLQVTSVCGEFPDTFDFNPDVDQSMEERKEGDQSREEKKEKEPTRKTSTPYHRRRRARERERCLQN